MLIVFLVIYFFLIFLYIHKRITVLHKACDLEMKNMVNILLDAGANINAQDFLTWCLIR